MNYFEAAGFVPRILQGTVEKHGQRVCSVNFFMVPGPRRPRLPNSSQAACLGARADPHALQGDSMAWWPWVPTMFPTLHIAPNFSEPLFLHQ